MPALQAENIDGIIQTTQRKLGRGNYNEIIAPYPQYVISKDLMMAKRREQSSGYGIQQNLMVRDQGNASWTGLYATETTDVVDPSAKITVDYKHLKGSWALDQREIVMNSGPEQIVSLIQQKRTGSQLAVMNLVERGFIKAPADSTDTDVPNGLQYWIVWASGTAGHIGVHPANFTDVGGLSANTFTGWRNYAGTYAAVSEDDLFEKWYEAKMQCGFMTPVAVPEYGKGIDYGYYAGKAPILAFRKTVRAQNENLGMEMGRSGEPLFWGTPIRWVPVFDDTAYIASGSDPIYGIDWKSMYFYSLSGWFMREDDPIKPSAQPTVRVMYTHSSLNLVCNNRRKNFVLAKATPVV